MPSALPTQADTQLPSQFALDAVTLVVRDLERAAHWYATVLGLHPMGGDGGWVHLGDGVHIVLTLKWDPVAIPPAAHAGLYHVALLYPTRQELARAALRLAVRRTPIQGASDHRTHEAIYLADPDGNGLELAADRPRAAWPDDLGYGGGPAPLDVANLLDTITGEDPPPTVGPGLRTGHVHLHVGDIDQAVAFYRDVIGFRLTAHLGTAAFFAAGDYHHHLGVNIWRGHGVAPVPAHTVGLHHWSANLPTAGDVHAVIDRIRTAGMAVTTTADALEVADPWGMRLQLRALDPATRGMA